MEVPKGYNEVMGTQLSYGDVFLLTNYLYGLRASGLMWNKTLTKFLLKLGFKVSRRDSCLFILKTGDLYILVYVDDLMLIGIADKVAWISGEFERKFNTKTEDLNYYLGVRISEKNKNVFIDQEAYIDKMIKKFNIEMIIKDKPYLEVVGSVMFLTITSRPDLMFATCFFARYSANYTDNHWIGLQELLQFIKRTKSYRLEFKAVNDGDNRFTAFTDTDYAGDVVKRRSTYGGIVYAFNKHPISWWSRLMKFVVLSSTEAEYGGAAYTIKEADYIRELFEDLSVSLDLLVLRMDNRSAIQIAEAVTTRKSKHIDVRFHIVRERVSKGRLKISWVSTDDNDADIFTKGLTRYKFQEKFKLMPLSTSLNTREMFSARFGLRRSVRTRNAPQADGGAYRTEYHGVEYLGALLWQPKYRA
jgi:hypothetical protein